MTLHSLGINQAVSVLNKGEASSEQLVQDCLDRIDQFDPEIKAWAYLDPEYALKQARRFDNDRRKGKTSGRLHGVPIALKDIIDSASLPTEHGCDLFKGNIAKQDSFVASQLKRQGAVIMGKTVTAELATFTPGKTRNPHNTDHTPGGSSSGSAAGVASYMVPGALGTQTKGSMIRPASFCGVVGLKPTYGLIPRQGILQQSPFLDQVGVYARSVEDTALLSEVLIGSHPQDPATAQTTITPALLNTCIQEPPITPKFALVKTAAWPKANSDTQAGLEQIIELLGDQADVIDLSGDFDQVCAQLDLINEAEIATYYDAIYQRGKDLISSSLTAQIERGKEVKVKDYLNAKHQRERLNLILNDLFLTYDALITPSAIGEAPKGLESTGDPIFCAPWTFCGTPAVNLPLLQGKSGLPIGVQLVGQRHDDARLLRTANWLNKFVDSEANHEK